MGDTSVILLNGQNYTCILHLYFESLSRKRCLLQGYTPLHIAMQFDHENIFNLLVQVYGEYRNIVRLFFFFSFFSLYKPCDGETSRRNTSTDLENILSGANQDIRDHSGKKARQYLASQEAAVSQDTFRSKYIPKKRRHFVRKK